LEGQKLLNQDKTSRYIILLEWKHRSLFIKILKYLLIKLGSQWCWKQLDNAF